MDRFTKLVLIWISITWIVMFIATRPKKKTVKVATCGIVVSKILDGEKTSDSDGNHYYTDYRVIVYKDSKGTKWTYQFTDERREEFYKMEIGQVFCDWHLEELEVE